MEKLYDVFISHSSKDKDIADAICNILESRMIRCWIAPRNIKFGEDWGAAINVAIENSKIFLLVYSENANQSKPIVNELYCASDNCELIIPFRIEDTPLSDSLKFHLKSKHWLDALTEPREKQIYELAEKILDNLPERKKLMEEREKAKREAEEKAEARLKAQKEAEERAAAEVARLKAQKEAEERAAAEVARLKAQKEAEEKAAAEAARLKAQKEAEERAAAEAARLKAQKEAEEKVAAEAARLKAQKEAEEKAAAEAARLKAQKEAEEKATAEAARLKAQREEELKAKEKKYDVYISHSSIDKSIAESICSSLESKMIRCWFAPRDLPIGGDWGTAISAAIKESKIFLPILTDNSNNSKAIERQIAFAKKDNKIVIPFKSDEVPLSRSMEFQLKGAYWPETINISKGNHLYELVEKVLSSIAETEKVLKAKQKKERGATPQIGKEKSSKAQKANDEVAVTIAVKEEPQLSEKDSGSKSKKEAKLDRLDKEKETSKPNFQPKDHDEKIKEIKNNRPKEKIEPSTDETKEGKIKTVKESKDEDKKKAEAEKKLVEEAAKIAKNMKLLRKVDLFLFLLSFVDLAGVILNYSFHSAYSPSLVTFFYLLTLSFVIYKSKSSVDKDNMSFASGFVYFLISAVVVYKLTRYITGDWPWILPYSYYITVPVIGGVIGLAALGLRLENNFFFTRFASGVLTGYWLVKVYLYYTTGDIVLSLTYGIQDTITEYGWYLLLPGVFFILFNRKSRLLNK